MTYHGRKPPRAPARRANSNGHRPPPPAPRQGRNMGKSSFASPEMRKAVYLTAAIPVLAVVFVVASFIHAAVAHAAEPMGCTGQETIVVSAPLVVGSGETLNMTGCTVVPAPGYNGNLLQNAAVQAGGRDHDVTVVGGLWARGLVGDAGGNNRHTMLLRHLDRVTVTGARFTSVSGKYAVAAGDLTEGRFSDLAFDTWSDGVHLTGPANQVTVQNITGTTGDDMVALTARDWTAYDDVHGDITNVSIRNVQANNSLALLKIISGTGTKVRGVQASDLLGTTKIRPVAIIDDTTGPTVADGIVISGMDVAQTIPSYGVVWLRGVASTDITFRDVRQRSVQTGSPLVLVDRTTNIRTLTIDGWLAQPGSIPLVGVYGTAQIGTVYLSRIGGDGYTGAPLKVGATTARTGKVKTF